MFTLDNVRDLLCEETCTQKISNKNFSDLCRVYFVRKKI